METYRGIDFNRNLAKYFDKKPLYLDEPTQKKPNTRKLVELPWQELQAAKSVEELYKKDKTPEIKAEREYIWNKVTETLCNLDFIQAKAVAKMTYDLVNDFNKALEAIPDNQKAIKDEKAHQARMDKYTQDLIACAKGEKTIDELEIPDSFSPWTKEQTDAEIDRIKNNPILSDRLKDFIHFLGIEAGNLQNYAQQIPHFTIQQAWNYTNSGTVGKVVEKTSTKILKSLPLRFTNCRPKWDPFPTVLFKLEGHTSNVNTVDITPNGKMAITGSKDNTIILWDLNNGNIIQRLKLYSSSMENATNTSTVSKEMIESASVNSISITPDGKKAISAVLNTCFVLDLNPCRIIQELNGHDDIVQSVSIAPDGEKAISGARDGVVIFWNLKTGKIIRTFNNDEHPVKTIAITPDVKTAVTGSFQFCFIWDLTTGEKLQTLKGHVNQVFSVSITPDGKYGISGAQTKSEPIKTCMVWDLKKGNKIKSLLNNTYRTNSVAITPDGKMGISGSMVGIINLWDLKTGKALQSMSMSSNGINAVAITPDGKMAISASSDKTSVLWNLSKRGKIITRQHRSSSVEALAIFPDGENAISGSYDKGCIIWNIKTCKIIKTLKVNIQTTSIIKITADGERMISTGQEHVYGFKNIIFDTNTNNSKNVNENSNDGLCIVWNLNTGKVEHLLKGHSLEVYSIAITTDGKKAITGSLDGKCIIWNLITGQPIHAFNGHSNSVYAVVVTPDERYVISAHANNSCILWEMKTCKIMQVLSGYSDHAKSVLILPDGMSAISSSLNNTCILWNLITGQSIKSFEGHEKEVNVIVISPNGKRAITGSSDNTCIIWDLKTSKPILKLIGHTSEIKDLAITPDGKRVISRSDDKTCILWDIESGKQLGVILAPSQITAFAYFTKGIMFGEDSGNVFFVDVDKNLLCPNPIIVTIHQIWSFDLNKYLKPFIVCPSCKHRSEPTVAIIQTISQILKDAVLKPDQSPCLELPDETWEHPGLIGECPSCHEKLKFNPFFGSDQRGIEDYLLELEKDREWQNIFENAENAFKAENCEEAFKLYLKLISAEKFDASYMRYNMAICRINGLTTYNQEVIGNINVLIRLLHEKGENERIRAIEAKLKERLGLIKEAEKPWWKKLF